MAVMYNKKKRMRAIIFVYATVVIDMLGLFLTIPIMANLAREVQGEPEICFDSVGPGREPLKPCPYEGCTPACDSARADINANVGLMNNVYAIGSLISSVVMPRISDAYGRKTAFIASLIGSIFGFTAMALAPNFAILLAVRLLAGLLGGSATVANAYITDVYPAPERGGMFARLGATIMCAVMFGPTMGGTLANVFGLRGPLWAAVIMSSIALVCAIKYIVDPSSVVTNTEDEESKTSLLGSSGGAASADSDASGSVELVIKTNKTSSSDVDDVTSSVAEVKQMNGGFNPWCSPAILAIGMQTFCATIAFNGISSLMSLLLLEEKYGIVDPTDSLEQQGKDSAVAIGLNAGTISIATLPSMLILFGAVSKRIGLLRTGTVGSLIFGAALFIMPMTQSQGELLVVFVLLGLGNGLQSNVSTTFLAAHAPPDAVARTLAVGSLCDSAASIVGPLLTQLYRFDNQLPYHVAAGCAWLGGAILMVTSFTCGREPKKTVDSDPEEMRLRASTLGGEQTSEPKKIMDSNIELGVPVFDREALTAVLFKGKDGVDYSKEFASDYIELIEELYNTYRDTNHLQTFRAGIAADRSPIPTPAGQFGIHHKVMTMHREMVRQHVPHLSSYSDDRDAFFEELTAMLLDLGHDDWATQLPGANHALQRMASIQVHMR